MVVFLKQNISMFHCICNTRCICTTGKLLLYQAIKTNVRRRQIWFTNQCFSCYTAFLYWKYFVYQSNRTFEKQFGVTAVFQYGFYRTKTTKSTYFNIMLFTGWSLPKGKNITKKMLCYPNNLELFCHLINQHLCPLSSADQSESVAQRPRIITTIKAPPNQNWPSLPRWSL